MAFLGLMIKYGWAINKGKYWHIAGGFFYSFIHIAFGINWPLAEAMGNVAVGALLWEGIEIFWHSVLGKGLRVAGYGNEEITEKSHFTADAIVDVLVAVAASLFVVEVWEYFL